MPACAWCYVKAVTKWSVYEFHKRWNVLTSLITTKSEVSCIIQGNNIFRRTNTRRHYQNKHFSLAILSHLWRRQLGIKSVNLMRHVGDSRPPIQLPQGLGWKLLVSKPPLRQAYFFDAKCFFFLHHWHKTYKLEHAITQTTAQSHSWEEDSCSCDEEKSLLCMEQGGPPSVIRGSFKLSWMQSTFSRPNLRSIHCNITATNAFVKYAFSALACTLFGITYFSIHCLF